ncbi:MAG: sacsin N-terminal ATP-binding-like domain-containing protein [Mycobacteriales bacterium]
MSDPFGTAAIRERVLAAWSASPARFREDANAEEDLTHGAYRDRLLVELAQNAADAAARAGVPGELRLSLVDGELRAANTGAPLDAAGVEALATLRASAKRDGGSVGRFGVGFAAVLTVTDEPVVRATTGGVRFSAAGTREVVAAVPELAGELARRRGRVPVLRLPWPAEALPPGAPGDTATEVRLPLRPEVEPAVRAALAELDPVLLLALPALRSIDADGRMLSRVDGAGGVVELRDGPRTTRWVVRSTTGTLPAELLTGRPAEERERPQWTVTWAVPVGAGGVPVRLPSRPVVYAPTPTDEPLSLPAVLLGGFPLASDRRHVTPGPVTDLLAAAAGPAYAQLVAGLPPTPALLSLVPRPALAAAELDAAVAREVLAALRDTRWLPTAPPPAATPGPAGPAGPSGPRDAGNAGPADGSGRIVPGDAVVVDSASEPLVAVLADLLPGLLPATWSGRGQAPALAALGIRRLSTADVVELVSAVDRPPAWWAALYAALADGPDREALSAVPVPLADGRLVTGVRGALLPDPDLPAAAAGALGLRVVHPDAAHPLLERLGAQPGTARGVLADDRVRAAVEASYDEEDPEPVADAVLALVAGARPAPGELPWLAELALPAADGDWYPAGELLLPGSRLAGVIDPDAPFETVEPDLVERWGPDVLAAVGVLETFAVLRTGEVELDPDGPGHDLDGEVEWVEAVLDRLPPQRLPPRLAELVAVRDLDLVRPDAWPAALAMLAGTSPTATVSLADGGHAAVPSYTSWWISTHRTVDGRRPDRLRAPGAGDLAGLYDPAPDDLSPVAGVLSGLDDVLADPDRAHDLLHRLGEQGRTVSGPTLRVAYGRLALVLEDQAEPPDRVRVTPDRAVPRERAVVLDLPYLLPLLGDRVPVPAGAAAGPVADLLDLPLASELLEPAGPDSTPARRLRWAEVPGAALAAERCGGVPPAATLAVHDRLVVSGRAVPWWPEGDTDHVVDTADASGRALAWRLGAWDRRAAATEALADPGADDRLRAEDATG